MTLFIIPDNIIKIEVILVTTTQICKTCGNDTFSQGILGNGFTSVTPANKALESSRLILAICKKCGEVASMKVENPKKFQ